MQKRQVSFLLGIFLLLFIAFVAVIVLAAFLLTRDSLPSIGRPVVALVKVDGVISDSTAVVRQLRKYAENSSVRAIVLRINSPGGAVGGSQEIYSEIRKVKKESGKPIVASFANVAASGGYYIACAADEIFANPGSLTGSIGVIFQTYDAEGVSKKLGIGVNTIKSGKYKDTGSMFRKMTPEERDLLQGTIDDTYEQFIEAILATRKDELAKACIRENSDTTSSTLEFLNPTSSTLDADFPEGEEILTVKTTNGVERLSVETVREYLCSKSDGRVLTGRQAMAIGLVDKIGTLRDAIDRAAKMGHIEGKPAVLQERRKQSFWDMMESRMGVVSKIVPHSGISLEYRLSFD